MLLRIQILFIFFSLSCGLWSSSQLSAQSSTFKHNHDFRLTVGMMPFSENLFFDEWGTTYDLRLPELSDIFSYRGAKRTTGAISLSYSFEVRKWFSLGLEATYIGMYQSYYNTFTHERISSLNQNKIALSPMCRFTYLRRRNIQLYSQLSMGVGLYMERGKDTQSYNEANYEIHLTYLGMTFGKNIYGIVEFGVGNRGVINAGIGYRFTEK
ncbi:MAG: hypothetical protein ACRCX4_15495 [Bacteroidales bacterium]